MMIQAAKRKKKTFLTKKSKNSWKWLQDLSKSNSVGRYEKFVSWLQQIYKQDCKVGHIREAIKEFLNILINLATTVMVAEE